MITDRTSHRMAGALAYVISGIKPREAAQTAGVSLQGLYRAMRRDKPRCPTCNRVLMRLDQPIASIADSPAL